MWVRVSGEMVRGKSLYKCICGIERYVVVWDVENGKSKGCGCTSRFLDGSAAKAVNTRHNKTYSKEWRTWIEFRRRCNSTHRLDSKNYSLRGILYDKNWDIFENFLADMGECPTGCSLDRIDNDGNYNKENCKWSTRKEQERNKRSNRMITIFCEQMSVAEACDFFNVSSNKIYQRLNRGWSPEKALLHQ